MCSTSWASTLASSSSLVIKSSMPSPIYTGPPGSVKRDVGPDAADVFLEPLLLGGERTRLAGVAGSELAPDRDFLLVGQPREMHGQARKITLRVGSHVQDRVR